MKYLTNSELGTFLRCQRKWFLSYVWKLEPSLERIVPPRLRGNLAHSALELWYATGSDPIELVKAEALRIRTQYESTVEYVDEEVLDDINKTLDLVLAMVEGYIEWVAETGVDQDLELLSTEQEIAIQMPTVEGVSLLGKLDARFQRRSDGARVFLDHKTVGDFKSLPRVAHMLTQFLHYNLIEYLKLKEQGLQTEEANNARTDGGIYNMLRTVKRTARSNPPFYERFDVRHNIHQLRSYYMRVERIAKRMLELEEKGDLNECPPSPDQTCAWSCEFFVVCSMIDDGSDWQGLIEEAYRVGDPLTRYVSIEKG